MSENVVHSSEFVPFSFLQQGSLMTLAKQGSGLCPRHGNDSEDLWAVGSVYAKAQSLVESDDHATVMNMQRKLNNSSPAVVEHMTRALLKFIVPLAQSANSNFVVQTVIRSCSQVLFKELFAVMQGNFGEIAESDHGYYVISAMFGRVNSCQREVMMQELKERPCLQSKSMWYRLVQ